MIGNAINGHHFRLQRRRSVGQCLECRRFQRNHPSIGASKMMIMAQLMQVLGDAAGPAQGHPEPHWEQSRGSSDQSPQSCAAPGAHEQQRD